MRVCKYFEISPTLGIIVTLTFLFIFLHSGGWIVKTITLFWEFTLLFFWYGWKTDKKNKQIYEAAFFTGFIKFEFLYIYVALCVTSTDRSLEDQIPVCFEKFTSANSLRQLPGVLSNMLMQSSKTGWLQLKIYEAFICVFKQTAFFASVQCINITGTCEEICILSFIYTI